MLQNKWTHYVSALLLANLRFGSLNHREDFSAVLDTQQGHFNVFSLFYTDHFRTAFWPATDAISCKLEDWSPTKLHFRQTFAELTSHSLLYCRQSLIPVSAKEMPIKDFKFYVPSETTSWMKPMEYTYRNHNSQNTPSIHKHVIKC